MAAICNCESGIINSGIPNCTDGFGLIVKLIFVYRNANDGTKNTIDCSLLSGGTFFTDKVNEADKSKRFFPSDLIYSIVDTRATPVTETVDNIDRIVTQGTRTFLGNFEDKGSNTPAYIKFLDSLACPKIMYYAIDEFDNVIGVDLGNGILDGFPIQSNSLYSLYIPKTATTGAKNQIGFSLDSLFQDSTISYIPASDTGENLLELGGLLDVVLANGVGAPTFDSVTLDANLVYGNACTKLSFTAGTEPADWFIFNSTTVSGVTVLPLVNLTGNSYQLGFTAQNSGDVLQVTLAKEGFESNTIEITLP